jgi:hypothetical protein
VIRGAVVSDGGGGGGGGAGGGMCNFGTVTTYSSFLSGLRREEFNRSRSLLDTSIALTLMLPHARS